MKIAPSMVVDDTNFVSSTVPEDDHAEWVTSTAYALGDRVIRTATHRIYEAAKVIGSSTVEPENSIYDEDTNPTGEWLDVSATNRWRPFDPFNTARASQATSAEWRVTLDYACDVVSLRNVTGGTAIIEVWDNTPAQTYTTTIDLVSRDVGGWWEFFFQPFQTLENVIVRNIPAFNGQEVRVTIEGATAAVAHIVIGAETNLGIAVEGTEVGFVDFSTKERDVFGNYNVVERFAARTASYSVMIPVLGEGRVLRSIQKSRATPTLFYLASTNQERGSDCFGLLKNDVRCQLRMAGVSSATIEVEGFS